MRLAAVHECVFERLPESIPNTTGVLLVRGEIEPRTRALSEGGMPEA
jgi:hypothetical protein